MKISPVFLNKYETKLISKSNNVVRTKNISFASSKNKASSGLQLYRCIGEKEYQKLIHNEAVATLGFVTSNPKGFWGDNWNNGYIPQGCDRSNCYFITFKQDVFDKVTNDSIFISDKRYRIYQEYSLKDIKNIRRGNNIHGELVWAENFEHEKEKDIKNKKQKISILVKLLKYAKIKQIQTPVIDMLMSYKQEFPYIENLL